MALARSDHRRAACRHPRRNRLRPPVGILTPPRKVVPPKKVQVGPYSYEVDISPEAGARAKVEDQNAHTVGNVQHSAQRINIDSEQGPDQLADTLLHEVLHAVWSAAGVHVGPVAKFEELVVASLTPTLLDTLRRNPDLVAYLTVPADG